MALSEQEEFELLSLERERAIGPQQAAGQQQPQTMADRINAAALAKLTPAMQEMRAIDEANRQIPYKIGGAVTDLTKSPLAGAAANVLVDVGTDPLTYVGFGAGKAAKPWIEAMGRARMYEALRPTLKDAALGKADRAAQTMLEQGLNVTKGGVAELTARGEQLNKEVEALIARHPMGTVDRGAAAGRIQDLIAKIESSNWTPQEARTAAEKVYDSIVSNPLTSKQIPLAKAQEFKQTIYKSLKDKYGEIGSDTVEAMKAGARGLKEEIEAVVPGIKDLNAKASDIWNAANVAQRRALMAAKNQMGGISWLAHNPWTFAASMADRSSLVQSLLGRFLYSGVAPYSGAIGAGVGAAPGLLTPQTGQTPPALDPNTGGVLYR